MGYYKRHRLNSDMAQSSALVVNFITLLKYNVDRKQGAVYFFAVYFHRLLSS